MASQISGVPISLPEAQQKGAVGFKTILSVAGIVAGLGAGGVGGYFIYDAMSYLNGTVDPAHRAYTDLPTTSPQTLFDSKYGAYTAAYGEFQSRLLMSAIVTGGGVALAVGSLFYLLLPENVQKLVVSAMLGLRPVGDRVALSFRLSWQRNGNDNEVSDIAPDASRPDRRLLRLQYFEPERPLEPGRHIV